MALSSYFNTPAPAMPQISEGGNPNQTVQGSLDYFLNPNSDYIKNARQRGVEYAASRGGLNSSIAAGAAERSAMESVMPLVNDSLDLRKTQFALEGQNWLDSQSFNRQIQGQLTMLPITNAFNMLQTVQQAALSDPELYGPDVISGYSNFFSNNMKDIMSSYFGGNE